MKRFGVLAAIGFAAVSVSGAWGSTAKIDLSTRAGVVQYLAAHGIDAHGIVIQRGNRNYAGARCPGARWNCTRASRVVQIATGKDAVNRAQITSDTIKSCSGGSISQLSTDGSDNIVQLSLSGPSASCNIVQQNTTGQNSVQLDEVSQQSGGNNQSASQDAFVTQYNLSGLNNFQLSQSVRQSISETATNISESETSTQTYTAYQFNDTGANSSQVTQTLSQSESDTRATSGTQYQSATLQGHVDQHSHGQSTSKNSQSESQTQAAKSNGAVVQTQSGPLSCCSIQEDKNTDIFRIDQSATQTQTPGKNGSSQDEQIGARCDTTGLCKVFQSYTVNGATTTNTCGPLTDCTITIQNSGEGVQKCTPDNECGFSGGEFPGPQSPPGGSYCTDFVTEGCGSPELSMTKTADSATVTHGNPIGFTIDLTNAGTAPATGVTISDTLPNSGFGTLDWTIASGPADCSISGAAGSQTLNCTAFDLGADADVLIHITSPTDCADLGTANNTATYNSSNAGGGSSNTASVAIVDPSSSCIG